MNHQSPTNQLPAKKKFEDQKNNNFIHSHKNGKTGCTKSGNTVCTTHFVQLCCNFMGSRSLEAYRTTKMASGRDNFLYEDCLDANLAIINVDIFENDEDMESEI